MIPFLIEIDKKIPLSKFGRKDAPTKKGWHIKYKNFPISKLRKGNSFNTGIPYEYGKTISIKNACRAQAKILNKNITFSVREHDGFIRVWRVK